MVGNDLRDAGILVTRPAHQAERLCRLIESHGGRAIRLPALRIEGPLDSGRVRRQLAAAAGRDLMIFISPNAVHWCLHLMAAEGLPKAVDLAAVGRATAAALEAAGYRVGLVPAVGYDSEALLAMAPLQRVQDRRILIVRGDGGRPLLGDILRQRGADVAYAEVYRRVCPGLDVTPVLAQWEGIDLVTATSNQILDNLLQLFGEAGRDALLATPLLVISGRMQTHARDCGWTEITVANGASAEALLAAVRDWLGPVP